jgi:nitrate/TMAO reductase-like tetraheme cytochrome c subunit
MGPFAAGIVPDWPVVVRVLGTLLGAAGVGLCVLVLRARRQDLASGRLVKLGVVTLPALAFYKLAAFAGLFAVPAAAVGVANYHVFEGTREVEGCNSCHVMHPMVNDMRDPHSQSLAARHYRNRWIADQQCYHCHTDYGLNGTLHAKMEGYRHLMRYTTHTYPEPVRLRGAYLNQNCLNCHGGTAKFEAVSSHQAAHERLESSEMNCLNCHGLAHPSPARRTPGHPDYAKLMEKGTE